MPVFEWDAQKAERNKQKHGIAFEDAALGLLGLALTRAIDREDENRLVSVCESNGRLITVVWTPRRNTIRIISARPASRNEKAFYSQSVSRSAQAREN